MSDNEDFLNSERKRDLEQGRGKIPHLNTTASSHRNASDLIPHEVIESWLKGEYLLGLTQSTGYRYVGWSLLLRGFYEYHNDINGEVVHWGYCYIDLKDGDLYYAGVRVNSGKPWKLDENNHPIYWRSLFSKFVGLTSEEIPRHYFGYIAHLLEYAPNDAPGQNYLTYAKTGDKGFFEWYFNVTKNQALARHDEDRLRNIDEFWREACRTMNQDTLPEKPNAEGIEPFRERVLSYLADRSQFDSDLALLEQLHPHQEILALVDLSLKSVEHGSLQATLHPLSRDIPTGQFYFRRLEQPKFL
jgi:hypothetical protein